MKISMILFVLVVLGAVGFGANQMRRIQDTDYQFHTLQIGDSMDIVADKMGHLGEYSSAREKTGRWGVLFNTHKTDGQVMSASSFKLLNVTWEVGYDHDDKVIELIRLPE